MTISLKLERKILNEKNTIGELYWEGEMECNTLEDTDRFLENQQNEKVDKQSAIPRGSFRVIIDKSERFKREMPHLLNVPRFTGVRIHKGNTEEDTEGCILVGEYVGEDMKSVVNSKKAFDKLFAKMVEAIKNGEEFVIEVI